jgi:hypothetical protein
MRILVSAVAVAATVVAGPLAAGVGASPSGASVRQASTVLRPDLVVSAVGNPPADATMLAGFSVSVATKNTGSASAPPTVTRLYLSHDNKWSTSDPALGDAHVPALPARSGASSIVVKTKLPSFVAPGTYYLLACADAKHQATELSETNNCRAAAHTMQFKKVSTQALIERDRIAGRIDYGTSLLYRAWALLWDPRLAAKYDGTGSTGEDDAVFPAIAAALPTLPASERSALKGYILRPTDAGSPFGPAGAGVRERRAANAAATTECTAPQAWYSMDWPNDNSDAGFRIWSCAASLEAATPALTTVRDVGQRVWQAMTGAEPGGMGLPVPDTAAADNGGNGKIDVYILDTNQCRLRNGICRPISGGAVASTNASRPCNGVAPDHTTVHDLPGSPAHACSAFMLMSRARLAGNFTSDFAHEFFHVLQYAHNWGAGYDWASSSYHWYLEASATWAEWNYANTLGYAPSDTYSWFKEYQKDDESLLEGRGGHETDHQYASWVWPLFQSTEHGAGNVFSAWAAAESADSLADLDNAIGSQTSFAARFRDFAVLNLQPYEYAPPQSSGLDDSSWQTRPGLADLPTDFHHLTADRSLPLNGQKTLTFQQNVSVKPLAAQYDRYTITDPQVREITIDIRPVTNASSADLDGVVRLLPVKDGPEDPWRRIKASGHVLTLCRDTPSDNADRLYVVISNHAAKRVGNGSDTNAMLRGAYRVQLKNTCDEPDHYDASFTGFSATGDSWTGNATFDLIGAASSCSDPKNSPPTSTNLHYCYGFKNGKADWSYANHGGGTSETLPILAPATDTGSVDLTVRDPDPRKVKSYYSNLSPDPTAHILSTPDGPRDAAFSVISWIATYSMPPGGFVHFGKDYGLGGGAQLCGEGACQGWTWTFTPRWGT